MARMILVSTQLCDQPCAMANVYMTASAASDSTDPRIDTQFRDLWKCYAIVRRVARHATLECRINVVKDKW
eukprot:SAG11_NODE_1567_length_4672_cov_13.208834_3_plen_71_part_00